MANIATVLPLMGLYGLDKVATHRLGREPWAFDSLTGALLGTPTLAATAH